MSVKAPKVDLTFLSPHYSTRKKHIDLIVVHATQGVNLPGIADLRNLGTWFSNTSSKVSCTVGVDDEGHSARYVYDHNAAWHCAAFNQVSLGIEMVGKVSQKYWTQAQVRKVAEWIAYWADKYDIPITHSTKRGVCRHSDLGVAGGNHSDPGPGFDLAAVLKLARQIQQNSSTKRPIKLSVTEKKYVDLTRRKRTIIERNEKINKKISDDHYATYDKSQWWLRQRANALLRDMSIKDREYARRKAQYLRDVAFDRNGLG